MAALELAPKKYFGICGLALLAATRCLPIVHAVETDVATISVRSPQPTVYLAGHRDGAAAVCVLDGQTLTIEPVADDENAVVVPLPPGTSVFDVARGSVGDATRVIAIVGEAIRAADVVEPITDVEWRELFAHRTLFTSVHGPPQPYPLLFESADGEAIYLPTAEGLVVVSLDGAVRERYDVSDETRYRVARVSPPPGLRSTETGGGLAIGVNASIQYSFDIPGADDAGSPAPLARPGTLQQMRDVANRQSRLWPWFGLQTAGSGAGRVYYALAPPNFEDTSIAIQRAPSSDAVPEGPPGIIGAPRRYPGIAFPPREGLPDFNADGYTDLVTWFAPRPGTSVASITRLLRGRTWPVRLQVFLYDPNARFYSGRPAGTIRTRVPITDFGHRWSGSPFRYLFLADCDGDHRTDVLLTPTDTLLNLWIYEDGFAEQPAVAQDFPAPIESIPLPPTRIGDRTVVVVHAGQTIYIVTFGVSEA